MLHKVKFIIFMLPMKIDQQLGKGGSHNNSLLEVRRREGYQSMPHIFRYRWPFFLDYAFSIFTAQALYSGVPVMGSRWPEVSTFVSAFLK